MNRKPRNLLINCSYLLIELNTSLFESKIVKTKNHKMVIITISTERRITRFTETLLLIIIEKMLIKNRETFGFKILQINPSLKKTNNEWWGVSTCSQD